MMRKSVFLTLLCLLSTFRITQASSQSRVFGRVVDDSGNPLSAATVYIFNNQTNIAAITNSQGHYVFLSVPEGSYTMKVFKRGLAKLQRDVSVGANITVRYDFKYGETTLEPTELAAAKPSQKIESPKPRPTRKLSKPTAPVPESIASIVDQASDEKEQEQLRLAAAEALREEELSNSQPEVEIQIKGGVEAVLKKVIYPESALKLKIEGQVVARVLIDSDGSVKNISLLKIAHELLNEEAIRVLTDETTYQPAMLNGNATAGFISVPIKFKIAKVVW